LLADMRVRVIAAVRCFSGSGRRKITILRMTIAKVASRGSVGLMVGYQNGV
jgi:hypothetical protein